MRRREVGGMAGREGGKTSDSCDGRFRIGAGEAGARGVRGGRRGGTGTHRVGRDVEAEVLHPRDGRPGPEGVTHLLFERRGSGDGARHVSQCRESVAETRDEEIRGRGSARGRAGPTSGGRGGAVRTSSSSSSSGRCGNGTRDGGQVVVSRRARKDGAPRGEEGIGRDATSRRDVVDPKRAGVRAPSCARSSGSSRGAARRLLLPIERAADGSEDGGGVR